MKTRKWKIGMLIMVGAVLLTAQVASAAFVNPAGPAQFNVYQGAYSSGSGGEFWAFPSQDLWYLFYNGYDGYTLYPTTALPGPDANTRGFATFCLETQEYFSPGGTYWVEFTNLINKNASPAPIPLNRGSARLYHLFQTQELDDIVYQGVNLYDFTAANRKAAAGKLQSALWILQGEDPDPGTNPLVNYAKATWADWALPNASPSGALDTPVKVVNMWTNAAHTGYAQDMIVCWSVSEPGILLLLGTGMLGLALVGRKTRRQRV